MNEQISTLRPDDAADQELMRRVCEKTADSQAALEQLYRRHNSALHRHLAPRAGHYSVEDLAQDAWVKVTEKACKFRGGSFRAWLFTIGRNHIIDLQRRERGKSADYLEGVVDDLQEDPADLLMDTEQMKTLQHCLSTLDEQGRHLVQYRLAGRPYKQIAAKLGLSEQQAHRRFFEAKTQLTHCVEQSS